MLRGRSLYPTATKQYLDENRSVLRSERTRQNYRGPAYLRQLQACHPEKRLNEFTEADLVAWLNSGNTARTALAGIGEAHPTWPPAHVRRPPRRAWREDRGHLGGVVAFERDDDAAVSGSQRSAR